MSSSRSRFSAGFSARRAISWKTFSPPSVSLWNIASRLCLPQTPEPPQGVSAAASSIIVQST